MLNTTDTWRNEPDLQRSHIQQTSETKQKPGTFEYMHHFLNTNLLFNQSNTVSRKPISLLLLRSSIVMNIEILIFIGFFSSKII